MKVKEEYHVPDEYHVLTATLYLITLCMHALNMAKSTVLHQNNKKININL